MDYPTTRIRLEPFLGSKITCLAFGRGRLSGFCHSHHDSWPKSLSKEATSFQDLTPNYREGCAKLTIKTPWLNIFIYFYVSIGALLFEG